MNNASGENICYKNVSSLTHALHLIHCGQILALTTGIAKRGEKESRSLALREPFPAPEAISGSPQVTATKPNCTKC